MSWIESHEELLNHPKLAALGLAMGWNKWESHGRIHAFWHWVVKYSPTGDLHRFNDAQLGVPVVLNGDEATAWVTALCSDQSRWIDRGKGTNGESIFRVHDWPTYAGKFLKNSRYKDRPEKWKEVLAVYIPVLAGQESLQSNSRVILPTNQPTNQPTSSDECLSDEERLDSEIRIFIGGHPMLTYSPKDHALCRKLVTAAGGWGEAKPLIDLAVSNGAAKPLHYALQILANNQAKERIKKPKATKKGEWAKQTYCPG